MLILGGVIFLAHVIAIKQPTDNSTVAGGFRSGESFKKIIKWLEASLNLVWMVHSTIIMSWESLTSKLAISGGVGQFGGGYCVVFCKFWQPRKPDCEGTRHFQKYRELRVQRCVFWQFARVRWLHMFHTMWKIWVSYSVSAQTISFSNAIHWFLLGRNFPQVGLMSDLLIWWFSQIRVEKNCRFKKKRKKVSCNQRFAQAEHSNIWAKVCLQTKVGAEGWNSGTSQPFNRKALLESNQITLVMVDPASMKEEKWVKYILSSRALLHP